MVAIYLAVIILALMVIGSIVSGIMENFLVSQRTQSQIEQTSRLAFEIAPTLAACEAESLYTLVYARAQDMGGRILVLDTDAVAQVDSGSQHNGYRLPYREVRDVLIGGQESSYGFHRITRSAEGSNLLDSSAKSIWMIYYTAPITFNGVYIGAILFSTTIQDVQDSINEVISNIAVVFVVVAALTAFISFFLAGWLTKPIAEMTAAIRRTGKKGYGIRVDVRGAGEIRELALAFNRMSEQIEAHDRVRNEFVANASHELKTPLSTMKLLAESILYQENPDPAMMQEFFDDINNEVDRLSHIQTELLHLVQDDAREPDLVMENRRLDELCGSVIRRLQPLAENKNIQLLYDLQPVSCDMEPMRMEQLLVNLVENAIKYTDKGYVKVIVKPWKDMAMFIVEDTGIGIPESALPHLFERFYRVDKARSRSTGGTGLGLAIVESIVLLHSGEISVESEPSKGSRFTVSFSQHQNKNGKAT